MRRLDNECTVLLRFSKGARGVLLASQIKVGVSNGFRIRLYGDKGGLVWRQERPNTMALHTLDGRTEIIRAGESQLGPDAAARTRTPAGHPKGYL
jgi:predicted dehydrogenase